MIFKFNKPVKAIIESSGVNDRTLAFAVGESRKLMHEFLPMDTGRLAKSVREFAEMSAGRVIYDAPYACYCYYGGSLNFNREKNQKAGAFWDKAMMQVYQGELYARVSKFIKNGRGD